MSQVPLSRNSAFSLLGLLVTAACLRFFLISDKSTFVDEVLHITWAKAYEVSGFHGVKAKDLGITQEPGSVAQAFAVVHRHNPLHQTLLNLWMRTLGSDSDFALRSMYAAFSVLSFDIDGLDPALCPHTGTTVPGGLSFQMATSLIGALVKCGRKLVGFDLTEVAPAQDGSEWDENVGARILYKLIGWSLASLSPTLPAR